MDIYIRILERKLAISYSFHKVYGPMGLGGAAYMNKKLHEAESDARMVLKECNTLQSLYLMYVECFLNSNVETPDITKGQYC